jgi:hypothetical protein
MPLQTNGKSSSPDTQNAPGRAGATTALHLCPNMRQMSEQIDFIPNEQLSGGLTGL